MSHHLGMIATSSPSDPGPRNAAPDSPSDAACLYKVQVRLDALVQLTWQQLERRSDALIEARRAWSTEPMSMVAFRANVTAAHELVEATAAYREATAACMASHGQEAPDV